MLSQQVPCRFYNDKGCQKGNSCPNLHVCKFSWKGSCRNGHSCRLKHIVDSDSDDLGAGGRGRGRRRNPEERTRRIERRPRRRSPSSGKSIPLSIKLGNSKDTINILVWDEQISMWTQRIKATVEKCTWLMKSGSGPVLLMPNYGKCKESRERESVCWSMCEKTPWNLLHTCQVSRFNISHVSHMWHWLSRISLNLWDFHSQ